MSDNINNNNREDEVFTQPQVDNQSSQIQNDHNAYSSSPAQSYENNSEYYTSEKGADYSESEDGVYNDTYSNVYPQPQQYGTQQQIYSDNTYQNPYNTYQQQNIYGNQFPQQHDNMYGQYVQPQDNVQMPNITALPEQPKKKKKTAKRVAVIAACLALVACVGIGGGFLGSMLADNSIATSANEETNSKKDENSKSSLTINKTEGTEVAATTTQEVAEKASESVVEITTETVVTSQFMQQYVSQGAGSGVIISDDGYIITNNHVISGANNIKVTLKNGKSYTAKLIGKDSQIDVALLKIDEKNLKPVTFGESKNLKVGETAIAIGNPLGQLGGTVTNGIISALDREITIDGETMTLLQTNAAINPGNSGGGLFNANAELVGLVVAKSSGENIEGLGFAIPIDNVVDILDDLMDHGYVTGRPSLGVTLKNISNDDLFSYRLDRAGVYIANITSGSAAEKAGLKVGDCITKIDDKEISSAQQASSEISKHKAGDKVTVTVYRDGDTKSISVTLDEEKPTETLTDENQNYFDRFGNYN